jgi:hypothetical protein
MKLLRYFSVIVLGSLLLIFTPSCKKIKQNRLDKEWKYIDIVMQDVVIPYHEVWHFKKDGTLFVYRYSKTQLSEKTIFGKGPYKLKKKMFDNYTLEIEDIGSLYDGKWEVIKLNKNELTILLDEYPDWKYRTFTQF